MHLDGVTVTEAEHRVASGAGRLTDGRGHDHIIPATDACETAELLDARGQRDDLSAGLRHATTDSEMRVVVEVLDAGHTHVTEDSATRTF